MPDFGPDIADKVLAASQAGAGEAAQALSQAFGRQLELSVGEAATLAGDQLPDGLAGAGLVLLFHVGEQGAALLVPAATGLLAEPDASPEDTDANKLQALAQQLSRLLLPEDLDCTSCAAGTAKDLAAAVRRAELADPAGHIVLTAQSDADHPLHLLWPLAKPGELLPANAKPGGAAPANARPPADSPSAEATAAIAVSVDGLPPYSRSLMSVKVPLVVTLAEAKKKVSEIVKLGPGTILQFEKPCEDMLDLEASGHAIAEGEAVKVGDKFGLRITSVRLPGERFLPVRKPPAES